MSDGTWVTPGEEFSTPEVHGSIIVELGRLTTRWGWLEAVIEDCIAGLLGTEPPLLYPITADIAIGTRIKHLGLLAKLRIGVPLDVERLGTVLAGLNDICGKRNALIHGLWYRAEDDPEVAMVFETRPAKTALIREIGMYANAYYIMWIVDEVTRHIMALHGFGKAYGLIGGPAT